MVGYYGQGVPTSVELENNSSQKKYTVNKVPKGHLVISKLLCILMGLGAIILIALAAVLTFFLMPKCSDAEPGPSLSSTLEVLDNTKHIDKRLPRSIVPTHYRIKLVPHLEGNFATDGFVVIKFNVTDDTRKIIFNMKDMALDEGVTIVRKLNGNVNIKITSEEYDGMSERYTLTTDDILLNGEQYELETKFTGRLNDYMQGFYRSSYNSNNEIRWMAGTQFSPIDARRAFPSFDEPSFKAKFKISIARPKNMTALSNMPVEKREPFLERSDWLWDHFQETPLMSTYLVAFVVSDLQPFVKKTANLNYTIWSRREVIDQTIHALDLLPRFLEYFESYFQIKYPLKKLDIVAIPDFGYNAMENWGLITFRETALLYQDKVSTVDDKRSIGLIIAHEICHQWFGNLVTPAWWDDLWLKEGFATYFEYIGLSTINPVIIDEFPISETEKAFDVDSLENSRPLSYNIRNNNEIRQAFDSISYAKGASLIRMINHILGDETFKKGLIQYLNEYQYSNAMHDNLWESLTNKAHEDGSLDSNMTIKTVMDTWTLKPGFPVVSALRNGTTVRISQHRFLKTGKIVKDVLWHIPISYTTGNNPNFDDTQPKLWLAGETETTFNLETQTYYLINLKQTGYYIVNYDERNWQSLIRHADKSLPAVIKGQLVCDSMDLAAAGLLDYNIPLRLIASMTQNLQDGLVPFMAMFNKLQFLKDILSNTESYGDFEEFIYTKFDAVFKSVDLNNRFGDSYHTQRLAAIALPWACMKTDSRCALSSHRLFRDWMSVDAPITTAKQVVYCTAIRVGGDAEWNFAFKQYQESNVPTEKNILLDALGCSSKQWVLTKYLNMILNNDTVIRKQDGARVFASVANNIVGTTIAFDFIRNRWEEINEYYGNGFNNVAHMIESLPKYMNTEFHLNLLKQFKSKNAGTLGTSEQALNRVIENVSRNVQWMSKNYKSVEAWLENFLRYFRSRK